MELKLHRLKNKIIRFIFLLIVPYGIETVFIFRRLLELFLLIVPYGIETYVPGRLNIVLPAF